MPIILGEAKIGTVVRPPAAVYMSGNCLGMEAKHQYVVTGKQGMGEPSYEKEGTAKNKGGIYTWLTKKGDKPKYELGSDCRPTDRRCLGLYQCKDAEVFLIEGDDIPAKITIEPPPGEPSQSANIPLGKKAKKGAGKHYKFAWDDDEITLEDLPRQAQVVAQLLHDTGKVEFEFDEIKAILDDNQAEIGGRQEPIKIFEFYRSKYMEKGLMTRS